MDKFFLEKHEAVLVIVDIQERLAAVMSERKKVVDNCLHLIELCKLLNIPVLLNEQYPRGLGPTVSEIKEALRPYAPLEKISFDCCKGEAFPEKLAATGRKKVILAGMETHVCVLQTVLELLDAGYTVHLVRDAVMSRRKDNWHVGLETARAAGAVITSTEAALFQLLKVAGTEEFKKLSKLVR